MQILQFLKFIERIIIFIVIAGFVPLTLFVFSASSLNVTDETQLAYTKLLSQIKSGYILDVRKDCNFDEAISFTRYCFQYCNVDSTCSIIDSTKTCAKGKSQLSVSGKKYCAQKTVKNSIGLSTLGTLVLSQNSSVPPLFSLQSQNRIQYYVYNGEQNKSLKGQTCRDIVTRLGPNIQSLQKIQSEGYLICLQYLFYTLIPIFSFTIVAALLQTFTRYDCKRIMQISLFNSCLISVSLIVIGVVFDMKSTLFEDTIKWLGQNCLISSTFAQNIRYNLTIDLRNGLPSAFTIIMGIVGILQIFLIIALLIIWIIEIRMQKLRKQDISSGYELQTL